MRDYKCVNRFISMLKRKNFTEIYACENSAARAGTPQHIEELFRYSVQFLSSSPFIVFLYM